jgi:peptide/nickel transport system permease protein
MVNMLQLLIKRTIHLVITLFLISIVIFIITQIMPGDVAYSILGQSATIENIQALREQLGLNRPLHIQYLSWLSSFVTFDLGNSLSLSRPIFPILIERLKRSLVLGSLTFVVITVIGIFLGIIAGLRKDKLFDHISSSITFVMIAIPEFVSGSLLILFFGGVWLQIFPASGYAPLSEGFVPWIMHLILPSTTLTMVLLAYVMRMMRSSMVEVLRQNYIRTARLNGLYEKRVILVHALKNALMPTVTLLTNNIGWLIGGIVIVETVFAYPGVGQLLIHAITYRDMPLLQATAMLVSSVYIGASILSDLLYMYLDPRTRGMD